MLTRVNDVIERFLLTVSILLLTAFIAVVFLQVLARNYLKIAVLWSDEVAVMAFVWSVFLGAAVAVRRGLHYVVEIFPTNWVRTNAVLRVFAGLMAAWFIYVMVRYGWRFSIMGLSRFSTAIAIPRFYYFVAVPISGAAMVLFQLEVLWRDLRALSQAWRGGEA